MEESLEAIQSDLAKVKAKIEQCNRYMERATPEQKEKIEVRRRKYEARRDRLAVAFDVLSGRAYVIWDIDEQLTVVKPNEKTARLIRTAEDYGARVTKVTAQDEMLL